MIKKTKHRTQSLAASLLLALAACISPSLAASVTNYDSIVSLATNAVKNYTFTDTTSGQSVVLAVTMSAYSPTISPASLQSLDDGTRVGGCFQNGFIDGSGVNFSAALVSASSGVATSTIKFGIAALGIRPVDGGGSLTWTSSVTGFTTSYGTGTEVIQPLDTMLAPVGYTSQLRFPAGALFQLTDIPAPGQGIVFNASFTVSNLIDPRTNSWFTTYAGKYARIYTSDVNKTNGTAVTTWSTGGTTQASPTYCGVQEIYSSSNWVYIRSSGLGSHVMGPWYLDTNHQVAFPNYPTNEHVLYKIPRTPVVPATKTRNSGGAVGYFVDGVAMFNSWDAYDYTNGADTRDGGQGGYWNRDAYVNEGASFDNNNAHQAGGQHHYHANPPALRYLLGDHVDFNSVTKAYPESTNLPTKHSPILGWVADGYPIYGPYGYSIATNAASGIRRMISGYVPRNGQHGNQNLTTAGRTYLPQWAVRLFNCSSNVLAGPAVSSSFPLGRYMEDNDYLGDLGYAPGTNTYDLDEYNGRWCVTPEFPGGTYAYFVSISSNGAPVFPYNIGRGYYGTPAGGAATSIAENVTTNLLAGPDAAPALNSPVAKNGTVSLTWSATEGGTYMVQSSTNLTSWTTNSTTVAAVLNAAAFTNNPTDNYRFYRVAQTALATYDSAGTGGGTSVSSGGTGPTFAVPGTTSVSLGTGTNFTLSITLPSNPPSPPTSDTITSVTLGATVAKSTSYVTQGTVLANFTLMSTNATGLMNAVVTFSAGPPPYTFSGAITITP